MSSATPAVASIENHEPDRGPYAPRGKRTYLCECRIREELPQWVLAEKIGATQQAVNQWESGIVFLSYERAEQLAGPLGEEPEILFAKHNLDTVTMYTERVPAGEHLTHRVAVMLLTKIRKVLPYRWKLPPEIRTKLNDTNRWLISEAFRRREDI